MILLFGTVFFVLAELACLARAIWLMREMFRQLSSGNQDP